MTSDNQTTDELNQILEAAKVELDSLKKELQTAVALEAYDEMASLSKKYAQAHTKWLKACAQQNEDKMLQLAEYMHDVIEQALASYEGEVPEAITSIVWRQNDDSEDIVFNSVPKMIKPKAKSSLSSLKKPVASRPRKVLRRNSDGKTMEPRDFVANYAPDEVLNTAQVGYNPTTGRCEGKWPTKPVYVEASIEAAKAEHGEIWELISPEDDEA